MFAKKSIPTDHKDIIHDVAFDFYGQRMATCSSDQVVKVWDLNEKGEWVCTNSLKSHNGSVWKVTWAHPEFGQILATCSFDRTALIWEENIGDYANGMQSSWYRRGSLVDSRSSVTDVKFAPKNQGLQLAVASAGGVVRVYESNDIMDLCIWCLRSEIQTKLNSCSCLSWNPSTSRLHPPLMAVGSDDAAQNDGKVVIFEFCEPTGKWNKVETIASITAPVNDVAFAPNLGRSYHLLAVATTDVRIIAVTPTGKGDGSQPLMSSYECKLAGQFDDHGQTVWRVSWNLTGTILASSGDDGCVRLWKANYLDVWKCISVMSGEEILQGPVFDKEGELTKERAAKAEYSIKYSKLPSKPQASLR